jgi:DNA polymerase III epsilon subunit-like protein
MASRGNQRVTKVSGVAVSSAFCDIRRELAQPHFLTGMHYFFCREPFPFARSYRLRTIKRRFGVSKDQLRRFTQRARFLAQLTAEFIECDVNSGHLQDSSPYDQGFGLPVLRPRRGKLKRLSDDSPYSVASAHVKRLTFFEFSPAMRFNQ